MPMRRTAQVVGRSVATISRVLAQLGPVEPQVARAEGARGALRARGAWRSAAHGHEKARAYRRARPPRHRRSSRPHPRGRLGGGARGHRRPLARGIRVDAPGREEAFGRGLAGGRRGALQGPGRDDQTLDHYNGPAYRSQLFARTCQAFGIKQTFTRHYLPQTNGKTERFIPTCLREWAYGRIWAHCQERTAWLPAFLAYYNARRPHSALGYQAPASRLAGNSYCKSTSSGRPAAFARSATICVTRFKVAFDMQPSAS